MIEGTVEPGFDKVRAAFEANFAERHDLGAAFVVVERGRVVVDMWSGLADRTAGRRWTVDTVVPILSCTKALSALCVLMLADRGLLDVDQPVARYWPEFAASGKADVLVREVLVHHAGVPGLSEPVTLDDVLEPDRMAERVAAQAPIVPIGATCYHLATFGWICGELVRRIDGRSIGHFFAEEVAERLGLETWIGLPTSVEQRVARLEVCADWGVASPFIRSTPAPGSDPGITSVWANPPLLSADVFPWNRPEFHAAEIAGLNGIGTARSLARLFGALALDGAIDGVRLVSPALVAAIHSDRVDGSDYLLGVDRAYGLGFAVQTSDRPFGRPEDAFGHTGAGGAIVGAWPSSGVGLAYLPNELRDVAVDDRRSSLLAALAQEVLDVAPVSESTGSAAPPR